MEREAVPATRDANKYTVGFLELLANNEIDKIALISADDIFSKGIAAGAKEWAERFGLRIMSFEEFKKGTKDLSQIVKQARASGAEVLVVCGHMEESINARLALKSIGWTPRAYYATVGPAVQKYHEVLKSDAEHSFTSSQWEPTSNYPGAKEFNEAFSKKYAHLPSYHAAAAYAAGQILEAAVRKAVSIEREKLKETLYTLDTITIIGRYGVDRTGKQIRHFTTTVQWQNGKKETIAPPEMSSAKPAWK